MVFSKDTTRISTFLDIEPKILEVENPCIEHEIKPVFNMIRIQVKYLLICLQTRLGAGCDTQVTHMLVMISLVFSFFTFHGTFFVLIRFHPTLTAFHPHHLKLVIGPSSVSLWRERWLWSINKKGSFPNLPL